MAPNNTPGNALPKREIKNRKREINYPLLSAIVLGAATSLGGVGYAVWNHFDKQAQLQAQELAEKDAKKQQLEGELSTIAAIDSDTKRLVDAHDFKDDLPEDAFFAPIRERVEALIEMTSRQIENREVMQRLREEAGDAKADRDDAQYEAQQARERAEQAERERQQALQRAQNAESLAAQLENEKKSIEDRLSALQNQLSSAEQTARQRAEELQRLQDSQSATQAEKDAAQRALEAANAELERQRVALGNTQRELTSAQDRVRELEALTAQAEQRLQALREAAQRGESRDVLMTNLENYLEQIDSFKNLPEEFKRSIINHYTPGDDFDCRLTVGPFGDDCTNHSTFRDASIRGGNSLFRYSTTEGIYYLPMISEQEEAVMQRLPEAIQILWARHAQNNQDLLTVNGLGKRILDGLVENDASLLPEGMTVERFRRLHEVTVSPQAYGAIKSRGAQFWSDMVIRENRSRRQREAAFRPTEGSK